MVFALGSAPAAFAQYQTPTLDGVISPGEYAHSSGNWSMTWDGTYVYIARSGVTGPTAVYLDFDFAATPVTGDDTYGNLNSFGDAAPGGSARVVALPFRANARVFAGSGNSIRQADGAGGWGTENTSSSDVDSVTVGGTREIRVRWAAVAGFTPFFFNWLGFDLTASGGLSNVTDPMPAANATGGAPQHYYYEIQSTIDGSATPPFEQRNSTWTVTSNADAGPDTLRAAITNANADTASVRRYIPFSLTNTTINLATNLDPIAQPAVIDATSQPGFDEMPLVVLRGYGTGSGGTPSIGLDLGAADGSSVKGFVIQNCRYGIRSIANNVVYEANYIGTNAAGTAAEPNFIGIYLPGGAGSIIGCSVFEERNVLSGNLSYQILVEHSSQVVISANVIGTTEDGIGAIGGGAGIRIDNSSFPDGDNNIIGGLSAGESNVIGYLTGNAIEVVGGSFTGIIGNKIGVGADGTTNAANGGMAVSATNVENLFAGTSEAGSANVIANNNGGVSVNGNPGGLRIRGNSMSGNSAFGISLTGSGAHQPAPVVTAAIADGAGTIGVRFSVASNNTIEPTQSIAVDLYEAAAGAVPQGKTLRASNCFMATSLTNETLVGSGFAPGAKIVLTATAYGDDSCSFGGDGTSAFSTNITPTPPVGSTTTLTAPHAALANETVELTATVAGFPGGTGGTVDFFADSVAISGCSALPLSGLEAVCTTSFNHTVSLTATYNGDTLNLGSTSPAATLTIVPRAFVADGNFTDPTKWSDGVVPPNGSSFIIRAACVLDAAMPNQTFFTSIYVGDSIAPGALTWTGSKQVAVTLIDGGNGATIDMTSGGTLGVNGAFKTAPGLTFIRGSGIVDYGGNGVAIAPLAYNHLITGFNITFPGGTAAVYGTMQVNGTFTATGGTIELRGIFTSATLGTTFHDLKVPAGASVMATGNFTVQGTMTVDGTFSPLPSYMFNLSGGMLTGSGTVKVTNIGGFSTQYSGPKTLTNLTVLYESGPGQPVEGLTYGNLTINNPVDATINGTAHVNGILTLTQGIVHTDSSNQLIVDNTSTSAVVAGAGWVTGNAFKRHFATGTNSYLFPVGVDAGPATATVKINAAASSDYATVAALTPAAFGAFEPASGIDEAKNVNLYHRIDFGATGFTYDATLNYAGFIDGGATPLAFVLRQRDNATLWHTTTATPAATSITATGLTSYASQHLLVGNRAIHHFLVSAGTSQTAGATFTTTVTAQDVFNATVNTDNSTVVTMSSSTGHAQFDSNGDSTFGDNTKTLSSGTFSIATKDALAESVTLTATAGGKTGTSAAITINSASTNIALLSSLNPSQAGQNVTFTASVTSATAGTITGTVTFKDGVTVLGSTSLAAGSAAFSTSALSVATHLITATYGGDSTFGPSVSNTVSQVVNASAFGAPQLFSATATGTSQVALSWAPVSGATSYEIFRNNALLTGTAATSLNDNAVAASTSYIYKVRALGPGTSAFSTPDAATTIVFTDANVLGAVIKAAHITELRAAVNAMRAVAGLGAATFTDPTLTPQTAIIKAVHITELRTALAAARTSLGVPALTFTDPTLTTGVTPTKAAHLLELRAGTQ
jgi:hypothetical protein